MLVVDNFGVKYIKKDNITHLIQFIKQHYKVTKDWSGDLYCGIKLDWNYKARTTSILVPGYIKKLLLKYKHCMPNQPLLTIPQAVRCTSSNSPPRGHFPEPVSGGQRVLGSILYYACAVDITVLMALSSIAIKQMKGMTNTMQKAKQLLDYLATNPDASIWYRASNIIINMHLDASYLSKPDARSRACRHFFMGWRQ
jgi:hypothetical protein